MGLLRLEAAPPVGVAPVAGLTRFVEYDVNRDGQIERVILADRAGKEGAAQREARRVIYRSGNRQITHCVRALGLGPRR